MNAQPSAQTAAAPDGLYEYDREPVPESKTLGPGYFAGAFAGDVNDLDRGFAGVSRGFHGALLFFPAPRAANGAGGRLEPGAGRSSIL